MIGTNITYWREQRNVTQLELAETIGTTQQMVSRWEKGGAEPKVKTLLAIAKALDITINDLIGSRNENRNR